MARVFLGGHATINKICENCGDWEYGECLKHDKETKNEESCEDYSPDPSRFCGICNSKATDDDTFAAIFCDENDLHYASHWDYEWHSIT